MHATVPTFADRKCGSLEDRLDLLVSDMIDLQSEGDATRQRLLERGHTRAFLDRYEDEARARANVQFVRDVNDDPAPSMRTIEDQMVEALNSLLPSRQFVEAEMNKRFPPRVVALKLPKVRARSAYAFAHAAIGAH
jgi:hypothetical protein